MNLNLTFGDDTDFDTVDMVLGPLFSHPWVLRLTVDGNEVDVETDGLGPDPDTGLPAVRCRRWEDGTDAGPVGPVLSIPLETISAIHIY